jgi:hypothetical protein
MKYEMMPETQTRSADASKKTPLRNQHDELPAGKSHEKY